MTKIIYDINMDCDEMIEISPFVIKDVWRVWALLYLKKILLGVSLSNGLCIVLIQISHTPIENDVGYWLWVTTSVDTL